MGFYPTTENACVMMRENHITKSCVYIIIYQDELYTASTTLAEILHIVQDKYKIKINPDVYLGSNFPYDPGGAIICSNKHLEKLHENVNILFKDKLHMNLHFAFKIIKLLIMKCNLNLIHNQNTYKHLHYSSRKRTLDKKYNEV